MILSETTMDTFSWTLSLFQYLTQYIPPGAPIHSSLGVNRDYPREFRYNDFGHYAEKLALKMSTDEYWDKMSTAINMSTDVIYLLSCN